jgi:AcrR family transcriptional regulator
MPATNPRRVRADARRNRERLLSAADEAFREHGTEASLEGVARRAGVAIGTLYAHFPNRVALASALLRERHDALFELGEGLPAEASALRSWVRAVVAHAAAYRGLAEMIVRGLSDAASDLHADCDRMARTTEHLVAVAARVGAIRRDVTAADVLALAGALAWTREQVSADQADRLLDFALAGLRPAGRS